VTPFRPTRTRRRDDPFLRHKVLLFSLGAGCAFAGMIFDAAWLVTTGIVILVVGVILRLLTERRERMADDQEAGAADEDGSTTYPEDPPA
jgi:hypothetical protein